MEHRCPSCCPRCAALCRTILDIPETRADWWELFSKHLRPRLAAGQTKLALVNSDKLA